MPTCMRSVILVLAACASASEPTLHELYPDDAARVRGEPDEVEVRHGDAGFRLVDARGRSPAVVLPPELEAGIELGGIHVVELGAFGAATIDGGSVGYARTDGVRSSRSRMVHSRSGSASFQVATRSRSSGV